ncbi:MAG: response regulator [Patescibacteria group bacterium]
MAIAQESKIILVIEDDPSMRSIVVRKLKLSGFDVIEAEDGFVGLNKWITEKPNLVILDLMLPEIDGFQILEQVRNNPDRTLANTLVIVLSNLWNKENIDRAKSLNIQGYFVKAYLTTEEIVQKVKEVLEKTRKA